MVTWRPCMLMYLLYIYSLCCKKVIYYLPRTVLFKIFRNQLHFQNMLQRTTACKSFKTPRCGSSSAILFLVETGTVMYVCEHEVWTSRSHFPNPRPGYEVDNSRVKLHQPRPEAAFQEMMNKTQQNDGFEFQVRFFFLFLLNRLSMYDNNK